MNPRQLKYKEVAQIREDMLKEQDGVCAICNRAPTKPVLDHSHKKKVKGTGKVRGVLCFTCNIFIAKSENNCKRYNITHEQLPAILHSMGDYLERPHYPLIHPTEAPKAKILKKSSYNKLKKIYKGRAKFPVYRVGVKNKKIQKLTKPLEKLFIAHNLKPEFYK